MKRLIFILPILLAFGAGAQVCPTCTIDLACDSVPANPKMCPANLPPDTAGKYYSADLTFYVPKEIQHPLYGTVQINQIDVIGVTNLPPGMTWAAYDYQGNNTLSFFPPANPPSSERGCAKICGTPPMPFNDSIYVSTVAYVTALGQNATQNSTFGIYLHILPAASGNTGFTLNNSIGCGSVNTGFTVLHPSNGNSGFSYLWNFGNGLQSMSENPPPQTYDNPGSYPVSLQTTIDTFPHELTQITVNSIGCTDIGTDPDLYLKIFDGNGALVLSTQSSPVSGIAPQTWNLSAGLLNPIYTVQVWDLDGGTEGGDDNCANGSETSQAGIALLLPGQGQYGNTTQSGTKQSLSLDYVINKPVIIFNDTAIVSVYANPSLQVINFSPEDSICTGDSALLWVDGGYSYQWYNDTLLLINENDSVYYTSQSGNYWVKVTNAYGCSSNSLPQNITVSPKPPKPGFIFMGNNTLKTFTSGFSLQWYLNGVAIAGATTQNCTISAPGYYMMSSSNGFCLTYSDSAFYTPTAIGEEPGPVNSFSVFPNPNAGSFTLSVEVRNKTDLEIVIEDMVGRVVFASVKQKASGKIAEEIQWKGGCKGVYFLRLKANEQVFHQRIIVQ